MTLELNNDRRFQIQVSYARAMLSLHFLAVLQVAGQCGGNFISSVIRSARTNTVELLH
jgi:hypothetical protein